MSAETSTRTNYIFIDYENIQDFDLDRVADKPVKVVLIVGARRKNTPMTLTRQLLRHHAQVELVESEGASKNALDLVLAYHVGQQAKTDPNGYFHILSKDQDYDALVQHLRKIKIRASRDEVFDKIPVFVDSKKLTLEQRVAVVLEKFRNPKVTRPAKRKTLLSNIHALLHKQLTAEETEQVLAAMARGKLIEVSPTQAVTYKF